MSDNSPAPKRIAAQPRLPKTRVRSRAYDAIMHLSVEHPLLTARQIAGLLKRNTAFVDAVMRSDAFLEERAEKIIERHGDKIENIRARILDTTADVLEAIQRRIADPDAKTTSAALLEALELLLKYTVPSVEQANHRQDGPTSGNHVNINLSFEDIERARRAQAEHARSIDLKSVTAPQLPKPKRPEQPEQPISDDESRD